MAPEQRFGGGGHRGGLQAEDENTSVEVNWELLNSG